MEQLKKLKYSQVFFYLFLISIPFNKRIIYSPEHAYIQGYFSYFLAIFVYISDILLFLCFMCYIIENLAYLKQISAVFQKTWFWLIIGLVIASFIGWLHVQRQDSLMIYNYIKLVEYSLVASYVYLARKELKLTLIAWIIYISGVFQAFIAIWQFHVQHGLALGFLGEYIAPLGTGGLAMLDSPSGKIIRAYGSFPHPNVLAAFLVFCLIFGYHLVSRETNKNKRILLCITNFLLLLGIFVTFSRATWLAAALVSFAYLWFNRRLKPKLLLILIPGIVACATILALWHGLLFARVSDITESNSYVQRVTYNQIGINIVRQHPWFGTGLGNYIPAMEHLVNLPGYSYQPPHNIFIYWAASTGLIGLILFLWLLWKIFSYTWNGDSGETKFMLLVLGFSLILLSMFDHFLVTIQQGQLIFALSLGLMIAYARKN